MSVFKKKTFCVITGASRGYGKSLAEKFAERFENASVIVLSARNAELLEALRQQLAQKHPLIRFFCWPTDLGDPCYKHYTTFLQQLFMTNNMTAGEFEQCLLVHNGGTLGDVSHSQLETIKREDIDQYWRINATSMLLLNAALLPMFNSQHQHQFVLHISSICATVPFKGFSLNCAGKAAREQLLNCLVLENEKIRVLHWAPGVMKTDMVAEISDKVIDPSMSDSFGDNLLTCQQSSNKLMALLERNSFTNMSRVDYYDLDEHGQPLNHHEGGK